MKIITLLSAVLLTAIAAVAQTIPAYSNGTLLWNDTNPTNTVAYFQVHLGTNNPVNVTNTTQIALPALMAGKPNGEYSVAVVAVSKAGVASDPSAPLLFVWVGKPSPPQNVRIVDVQFSGTLILSPR